MFVIDRMQRHVIIPEHPLRDRNISLRAKGLLAQMLSLPSEGSYSLMVLQQMNRESEAEIRRVLKELEAIGYLSLMENGKEVKYVIHENPIKESRDEAFMSGSMITAMEAERLLKEREGYRKIILENISYECLCQEFPFKKQDLIEIVELILDTVCSSKSFIRIAGEELPKEVVKSRLLKLDAEHIRYVLDCMDTKTTKVWNIRQYLLTALYNAPVTISNYYAAMVNHDMYGGGSR